MFARRSLLVSLGFVFAASAAHAAPSAVCTENGLASLTFSGIPAIRLAGDACAKPEAELPANVRRLVAEIGEVNRAVAKTIGQSWAATFGPGLGVGISFMGLSDGALGSETLRSGGVMMHVFPDETLERWPRVTYAHEITHLLVFRGGAFAPAVRGLEEHPFVMEALPDLVALTAHGRPVMPFEDTGLPPALGYARDSRPLRSLNEPMASYTLYAPSDRVARRCAKVPKPLRNAHTASLCETRGDPAAKKGFYGSMSNFQSDLVEPSAAELAKPFDPANCLFRMKGVDVFGGCNSREFASPLASFFFTLAKTAGRPLVAEWIRILKAEAPRASRFRCAYRAAGTKPVELVLRGVAPSLRALRDVLAPADRPAFDRAWKAHGFEKLADLDALFVERNRANLALLPLATANPAHAGAHWCASPFTMKPAGCALDCAEIR